MEAEMRCRWEAIRRHCAHGWRPLTFEREFQIVTRSLIRLPIERRMARNFLV
jgi:hypothetical protein